MGLGLAVSMVQDRAACRRGRTGRLHLDGLFEVDVFLGVPGFRGFGLRGFRGFGWVLGFSGFWGLHGGCINEFLGDLTYKQRNLTGSCQNYGPFLGTLNIR